MNEELALKIGEMHALTNAVHDFFDKNEKELSPPFHPKHIMRIRSESALHARALEDAVYSTEYKQAMMDKSSAEFVKINEQLAALNAKPAELVKSILASIKGTWLELRPVAQKYGEGRISTLCQVASSLHDEYLQKL